MKKHLALFILLSFIICPAFNLCVRADEVIAPRWEDYVPEKYLNPRTDCTRGGSIAEMSVGILLTDLIITAPIGIPMLIHGKNKVHQVGYRCKKKIFYDGLKEAESISDPIQKEIYYKNLLAKCKFTEEDKQKVLAEREKKAQKETKKNKKSTNKDE